MEVKYVLERKDMNFAHDVANLFAGHMFSARRFDFFFNLSFWTFLSVGLLNGFRGLSADPHWIESPLWVVVLCLGAAYSVYLVHHSLRARKLRASWLEVYEPYPLNQKVTVHPAGVDFEGRWGKSTSPWSAIYAVRDFPKYLVVVLRPCQVCVIPNQAFQSSEHRASMLAFIAERVSPN